MNQDAKLTPQLIRQSAQSLVGASIAERDLQPLTELLQAILQDMAPLRRADVSETEPAVVFEASER